MKSKNETDLADYQDELAGRATGKERRFFKGADRGADSEPRRAKDARETATLTALQIAMQDADYARAWHDAWDAYELAQGELDQAILDNADALERLKANAARLEDGTIVFMRPDGTAETADGQIVPESALAAAAIPEDATTAAGYRAAMQRAAELARIQTDVLDPAAERMHDHDNTISLADLAAIEARMDAITVEVSATTAPAPPSPGTSQPVQAATPTPIDLPALR